MQNITKTYALISLLKRRYGGDRSYIDVNLKRFTLLTLSFKTPLLHCGTCFVRRSSLIKFLRQMWQAGIGAWEQIN